MKMKTMMALGLAAAILVGGCAAKYKKEEKAMKAPINCATAEGDLRVLMGEKAHVADQIAMGVSAIAPIGLVVGVATGTEGTKMQVATGEYDKMIDQRIKEIKEHCGIK